MVAAKRGRERRRRYIPGRAGTVPCVSCRCIMQHHIILDYTYMYLSRVCFETTFGIHHTTTPPTGPYSYSHVSYILTASLLRWLSVYVHVVHCP